MIRMIRMIHTQFSVDVHVNYRVAQGARGASHRMELPEGRRAPNHVNYKVLGL